jgi:hypothetical protein
MADESQTLKSHTRFDPLYHFFLAPLALAFIIESIVRIVRTPDWTATVHLIGAVWAFVLVGKVRTYPLKVQDRVIRLEERLRLREQLPTVLQPRISELTEDQLIGLRFASDAELPDLVPKALDGKWNRRQIKQAIRTWRSDTWRV